MVRDLFGRPLEKGDQIIMKNIENLPFVILDISGPIMRPSPQGPIPVHVIQVALQIPVNVVGDNGVQVAAYRIVKSGELDQEKKLVI